MQTYAQIGRRIERLVSALATGKARPALLAIRWAMPAALLAYLGYTVANIGLQRVWDARPASLSFYLLLCVPFFVPPLADVIVYRTLWRTGRAMRFSVLLRKQCLNSMVLDYSGEAYFYFWAQRNLKVQKSDLLHAIKDSNVLSSGAGLVVVWLLLTALLSTGAVKLPAFLSRDAWIAVAAGVLPLILCVALVAGGNRVTTLSRGRMTSIFAIHLIRSVVLLAVGFSLWWLSGALPTATACLEFVALRLVVSRLPLVPNKGLVFAGLAITAAGMMNLSAPRITAVLLISFLYDQVMAFALVGLPWALEHLPIRRPAAEATM